MIDIHNHFLPFIDDGSPDIEHSLDMAEIAVSSGVSTIIATPHCNVPSYYNNYYTPEFMLAFHTLQSALENAHIPLRVLPGMEVFTTDTLAALIHEHQLIGLNFSNYLLIEFDFSSHPDWMTVQLQSVCQAGQIPVIAHPERYDCIQDAPYIAEDWLKSGCLLQCNKDSFLGGFGRRAEMAAHFLLEHQMISFIASDAHRATVRNPQMYEIYRYISSIYTEETAHCLMQDNPQKICMHHPIPQPNFIPFERTSYWEI